RDRANSNLPRRPSILRCADACDSTTRKRRAVRPRRGSGAPSQRPLDGCTTNQSWRSVEMTNPRQPPDEFDLQPDPRILPMLGEITLPQWRCLAEFIDNSVDAFLFAKRAGHEVATPEIHISVPTADPSTATVTVTDNGTGMDPATLEKAVRAGWTSNDPIR